MLECRPVAAVSAVVASGGDCVDSRLISALTALHRLDRGPTRWMCRRFVKHYLTGEDYYLPLCRLSFVLVISVSGAQS